MKKTNKQKNSEFIILASSKNIKLLTSLIKYFSEYPDLKFHECFTNWYKINRKVIEKDAKTK